MQTWQKKVQDLMREQNISQRKLAGMMGMKEATLSRDLHEKRNPRSGFFVQVGKALGVSPGYLLDDTMTEPERLPAFAKIGNAIARRAGELTEEERLGLIRVLAGSGKT